MGFWDFLSKGKKAAPPKKAMKRQTALPPAQKGVTTGTPKVMNKPEPIFITQTAPTLEDSPPVAAKICHLAIVRGNDGDGTESVKRRSLRHFLSENGYDVAHIDVGSDRGLFERLAHDLADNPKENKRFFQDVAAFYGMDYREDIEGLHPDNRGLEELGFNSAKEKGYVPVMGGQILTCDPFVDICNGSRLTLTTAVNVHQLLRMSTVSRVDDDGDPQAILVDILERAVLADVSDVHIEPRQGATVVRFRVDGILQEVQRFEKGAEFHERMVNKVYEHSKIEASMFASLHDESFTIEILRKSIFIRVSSVPVPSHTTGFQRDSHQASLVMRLLYSRVQGVVQLESLGYTSSAVTSIKKLIKLPYGIILMCGPTGSGKTTTLYSMMDLKRQEPVKIVAIEDPVEYPLDGIIQVEVNRERRTDFANAIRSFLRHDPDVILIGEIRDKETAQESLRAALTGHLVLATLHANTAAEAIPRLLNLDLNVDQLLAAVKGVIAQRLVRKLCPHCRVEVDGPASFLGMNEEEYHQHYNDLFAKGFWAPKGCRECDNTGYKGRTVLWEILLVNSEVKRHIVENNGFINTREALEACGQPSMRDIGIKFVQSGVTSLEEIERFIPVSQVTGALM